MSFLILAPELLASTAEKLESLGSTLSVANAAATLPTTGLMAAGADEISAAAATIFARFGQEYQILSTQASAFHQQFIQTLSSGAASYLTAETTAASSLQVAQRDLLAVVNAPTELLLGRPLIGNGVDGTAASPNGGAGGLLYGDGGHGYSVTVPDVAGGAGGAAGLIGTGGIGGANAPGGAGGHGGWLFGAGGSGGQGGSSAGGSSGGGAGGAGGAAGLLGVGGNGGAGGLDDSGYRGGGGIGRRASSSLSAWSVVVPRLV